MLNMTKYKSRKIIGKLANPSTGARSCPHKLATTSSKNKQKTKYVNYFNPI